MFSASLACLREGLTEGVFAGFHANCFLPSESLPHVRPRSRMGGAMKDVEAGNCA